MAPIPVCFAWHDNTGEEWIATWRDLRAALTRVFKRADFIVGVNFAYDAALILQWLPDLAEMVWAAYDAGRILDLGIIERLAQITTGQPQQDNSLGMLARRYGLGEMQKTGGPRTNYGYLFGLPLECYPDAHVEYALKDVRFALKIFGRQMTRYQNRVPLETIQTETYSKLWAHLFSAWGLRSDHVAFDELEASALARLEELTDLAKQRGFVREDGSQNKKAIQEAVSLAYEGNPPMTEPAKDREEKQARRRAALEKLASEASDERSRQKHLRALAKLGPFVPQVSTSKTTLRQSGDEFLKSLAQWGEARSIVNKDLKLLRDGLRMPIHTRFGLADTLRTTTSRPNIQNFGRKGGARECITARHAGMPGAHGQIDVAGLLRLLDSERKRREQNRI